MSKMNTQFRLNRTLSSETTEYRLRRNTELQNYIADFVHGDLDGALWEPYLLTFMFKPIPKAHRFERMKNEVERVYSTLVTRVVRHPKSAGAKGLLPVLFACPDRPVPKSHGDQNRLADTQINDGEHMHGIILLHPNARLRQTLHAHVREKYCQYVPQDRLLRKLDVRHIAENIERTASYAFKSLARGLYDSDHLIVLPRAMSELR
jgi:hypothetical protein